MDPREISIVRTLARAEVEQHTETLRGVTASVARWETLDTTGAREFVVDVRVGVTEGWVVVRDVLVASDAVGIVGDLGTPVRCERSAAGRLTVVGLSDLRLPDVRVNTYSPAALDMTFLAKARRTVAGIELDGFDWPLGDVDAGGETEEDRTWDPESGWS